MVAAESVRAATPTIGFLVALREASPFMALITAVIATAGSLYFSEVLGWVPCMLCWYQRIFMYPLTALLLIGILRRDLGLHWYILPLSLFGGGIALYHYLLTKTFWFPPPTCASGVSCAVDYLDLLGFINIPFLALTAFVIISIMMAAHMLQLPGDEIETEAA
jgi:disulfide bond formation protein DsbB